jgi:hypothetical protein
MVRGSPVTASQRHHGLEMEIKRKARKTATQTTSTPKAQIQLCVGRIAIHDRDSATLSIIQTG